MNERPPRDPQHLPLAFTFEVERLCVPVWSPEPGGKRQLRVDEPGALPLQAGELVHLEARLNQPAHLYLLRRWAGRSVEARLGTERTRFPGLFTQRR